MNIRDAAEKLNDELGLKHGKTTFSAGYDEVGQVIYIYQHRRCQANVPKEYESYKVKKKFIGVIRPARV